MLHLARRAAFAALGTMLLVPAAHAAGAIAVGIRDNDASKGLSYGVSYDFETEGEAKYEALSTCLKQDTAPEVRANCTVIATFHGKCSAVAIDKMAGTPGWGWAVADNKSNAEKTARDNCRAIAGAGRADFCEIADSDCDAEAPKVSALPSLQTKTAGSAAPRYSMGGKR